MIKGRHWLRVVQLSALVVLSVTLIIVCKSNDTVSKDKNLGTGVVKEDVQVASVNDNIDSVLFSSIDNEYHNVVYSVSLVSGDEAWDFIQGYNKSDKGLYIFDKPDSGKTYYVMNYKIKFPKGFPHTENGVVCSDPVFSVTCEDTENTVFDVSSREDNGVVKPGDTFNGRAVFMVDKNKDFTINWNINGETYSKVDVKVK